ncbi:MAG: fibronectin type III domain-containing protein [Deltaproteobacteria bacterium]|nr:fibronectin type III domain-containing protein [Deltaproteobacteria bacterium]
MTVESGKTMLVGAVAVVTAATVFLPVCAEAEISGFEFNGIAPVGDFELDDRIGPHSVDTEHVINVEDCKKYSGSIEITWSVDWTPADGTKWGVKMSEPGGTCSTSDLSDLGTSCYQEMIQHETDMVSSTNNKFTIPMDPLMGGDCSAGTEKSTVIYIIINEAGVYSDQQIIFDVDLAGPTAPVLSEPSEGDSNVTVKWTDDANSNETDIRYRVYWSDSKFDDSNKDQDSVSRSDLITASSYKVPDLTNEQEYWFGVTAVDNADNESPLSAVSSAMPIEAYDFFEYYKDGGAGGRESGGFCFIATAAWGSPMAGDVMALRAFRDRFLLTWWPGRLFVKAYYLSSPPLAWVISKSEALRALVRTALWPLVQVSRFLNAAPAWLGAGLLFSIWLIWGLGVSMLAVTVRRRRRGA